MKTRNDILESMATVDPSLYDLRRLHKAVQHDVHVLTEVWAKVKDIDPRHDTKLNTPKDSPDRRPSGPARSLIFTYYKDTARYLYRQLGDPDNADAKKFRKASRRTLPSDGWTAEATRTNG